MVRTTEVGRIRNETETAPDARRQDIERLIDEIVAQTFPASDPPAWGAVSALLREQESRSGEQPGTGGNST